MAVGEDPVFEEKVDSQEGGHVMVPVTAGVKALTVCMNVTGMKRRLMFPRHTLRLVTTGHGQHPLHQIHRVTLWPGASVPRPESVQREEYSMVLYYNIVQGTHLTEMPDLFTRCLLDAGFRRMFSGETVYRHR